LIKEVTMKNANIAINKITASLEIERKIVGVKFLFTKEEYEIADAKPAKAKLPYCVMVKLATRGTGLKATLELSGCGGGTRALGLEEPSLNFQSGCEYNNFGLYQD